MSKGSKAWIFGLFSVCVVFAVLGGVMTILSIVAAIVFFALAGILFIFALMVVILYNQMVTYRNKVKESLALIDIQLKMRFDLIPNLVESVKGYTKHEEKVFKSIARLRNLAMKSTDEKEVLEYANKSVPMMKSIIAIAEDYPELKSGMLFQDLMSQLSDVEDRIAASRRIYDMNVNEFNTLLEKFPNNLFARSFGFVRMELFKIDSAEKVVTKISLQDEE